MSNWKKGINEGNAKIETEKNEGWRNKWKQMEWEK